MYKEKDDMKKRGKRVIVKVLIGGILACIVAVIWFGISTYLGADRPFLFRLVSPPVFIPLLFSKLFWPILWPNDSFYIYEILGFSLIFYFFCGGLIGLTHSFTERRIFYPIIIGILAIYTILVTGFYLSDLPSSPQVNHYHRIESAGFAMPLWVRGRIDSNIMILHLHGGPGDTAIRFSLHPAYRKLESKYAVAYWDQPGSGNSRWLKSRDEIPVSDITRALDDAVTFIHEEYPDTHLFLLGHSFGGEVGVKYLTEYPYHGRVMGWIEVDGTHNELRNRYLVLDWLKQKASSYLQEKCFDSAQEEQFWIDAIEYVQTHRFFEKWYETELWDKYIERAGGYSHSPETKPALGGIPHYLLGRANFILERINLRKSKKVFRDALETDYTPEMKKITIPTLILWGRYDGAVVVNLAWEAYKSIGTEDAEKEVIIFKHSGHNPMLEEPDKYVKAIEGFIEKHAYY
jgi:pimeloyl-ACP methyl ester carboxylesterase